MDNSDISHEGHRKRLLDTVINAGLENLSDVQIVEFMLTYVFPRGDVNPLAHRLLDAYGTLGNILEAKPIDLMSIRGINERSAKKIHALSDLFFSYTTSKMKEVTTYDDVREIIDLVELLLRFRKTENLVLLGFSASNLLCGSKRVVSNETDSVSMKLFEVTAFLSSVRPHSLVVAHCHPSGIAFPSSQDEEAFSFLKNLCFDCGVNLIDSYIVGENGVYSQNQNILKRQYFDIEDVKDVVFNKHQ